MALGAVRLRLSVEKTFNKCPGFAERPGGASGVDAGLLGFWSIEPDEPDPHVALVRSIPIDRVGMTDEGDT